MHKADRQAETQFSQPFRQILTMLVIVGIVGVGGFIIYPAIGPIFENSPYLNGFILAVFLSGVAACFMQVVGLISAVNWIEGFAISRPGHEFVSAPRLLSSLATLLQSRGARMQIGTASATSILDSIATRLDETREITRYITNLLIFLGLLGTFYGLATTIPGLVDTISSLNTSENEIGSDVLGRLTSGLGSQLGGMGTAFASSLLGLAGSLVVGLLDIFASRGQNRFYRELEEWMSTITRVGFSADDQGESSGGSVDTGEISQVLQQMVQSLHSMQGMFEKSDTIQAATNDRIALLSESLASLTENIGSGQPAAVSAGSEKSIDRMVESQERLLQFLQVQAEDEPEDAESRMRLRSIDVQLLRILEEMAAGRQDTVTEIRTDLAALNKALRQLTRRNTGES